MANKGDDVFYVDGISGGTEVTTAAKIVGFLGQDQDQANLVLFPDDENMIGRMTGIWKEGSGGNPSQYPFWRESTPLSR